MQLDSADEQAAAIRRELDGRMQRVSEMEKVNKNSTLLIQDIYNNLFSITTQLFIIHRTGN